MPTEALVTQSLIELNKAVQAGLRVLTREQRRAFLGAAYEELVGYDPFEDDPSSRSKDVLDMLLGNVEARILESE